MTTMFTPYDQGNAIELGRLWRKQVLPIGQINYKGRVIDFTREYLAGLVRAFNERAYDQVPFQLADAHNTHTNDPERCRGWLKGMELTEDGLDMLLEATEEGDQVLRKNPRLGVSARIVEQLEHADGRRFPAAIQHVLGTLDPRVTGMRPWQAIEAAGSEYDEVIDLTNQSYTDKETGPMAPKPLTDEEREQLRQLLARADEEASAAVTEDDENDERYTDEELDAYLLELLADETDEGSPAEDDEDDEELNGGVTDDADADPGDRVPTGAGADLSNPDVMNAIELQNAQLEQTSAELARVTEELDQGRWTSEREALIRDHGIPPAIVDLAEPLLYGSGHEVELANGDTVDAGAIVRRIFTEVGKRAKLIELGNELGTNQDLSDDEQAAHEELANFVTETRAKFGL